MTCHDVQKFVYVYLDGEFGPGDKAEYEAHVADCAPCREAVSAERGFRQTIRTRLQPVLAPPHLRSAIVARLATVEAESRRSAPVPWALRLSPVLALAAAILLVVYWPRDRRTGAQASPSAQAGFSAASSTGASWGQAPVVTAAYNPSANAGYITAASTSDVRQVDPETAMTLQSWQHLPVTIQGGEATIRRYLEPRVGFRVAAPLDESVYVRLVGARQVAVGGRPAVLFVYDFGGERVTVVSRPGAEVPGAPALQLQKVGTLTVGQFERAGAYNVVLTDLEPGQLHAILPAAVRSR